MRIVLVGAVESTKVALETLIATGTPPTAVVSLPGEALSRHSDAVDLAALSRDARTQIVFSTDINSEATLSQLKRLEPDLILVIGWSQVCKQAFRAIARQGCIGFHPSALPRLRGRAVIPWTILTRQAISGSTFFWLDDGIDTGDIAVQHVFELSEDETARSLYDRQLAAIRNLLPQVVAQFETGKPQRIPQGIEGESYCARRGPEDGVIDWRDPADSILTLIRAVGSPYPGAFTTLEGERLVIDRARACAGSGRFIGLTGQVQAFTDEGFVVRCGDGACIEVLEWRWERGKKPARHVVLGRA